MTRREQLQSLVDVWNKLGDSHIAKWMHNDILGDGCDYISLKMPDSEEMYVTFLMETTGDYDAEDATSVLIGLRYVFGKDVDISHMAMPGVYQESWMVHYIEMGRGAFDKKSSNIATSTLSRVDAMRLAVLMRTDP